MAHTGTFPIEGNVVATPHAIEQARPRFGEEFAGYSNAEVAAGIEAQVREAIEKGRVFDVKPRGFRLYGEVGTGIMSWQRFVQHLSGDKGWVIGLDSAPDVTVVTSLRRVGKVARL